MRRGADFDFDFVVGGGVVVCVGGFGFDVDYVYDCSGGDHVVIHDCSVVVHDVVDVGG